MQKLSVVIPAYNEAERIGQTIVAVNDWLSQQQFDFEILVVVDGATDNTAQVVADLVREKHLARLRLLSNQENYGKGFVVRQGLLAATGDVRLFTDADNSTTVDQVASFLPAFASGADVVIGSRRIPGANIVVHQGWFRDFLGGVFRFIVHTLVPVHVTDSQCGFKAFTDKAVMAIFPLQTINRWAFDVEILAIARMHRLKIVELPVRWVNDGASHVKLGGMARMLLEVLQIRLNIWRGKYRQQN